MVLLTRELLPLLMLGVVMPALDQFSDVAFALRLMGGPANDTILLTGKFIAFFHKFPSTPHFLSDGFRAYLACETQSEHNISKLSRGLQKHLQRGQRGPIVL